MPNNSNLFFSQLKEILSSSEEIPVTPEFEHARTQGYRSGNSSIYFTDDDCPYSRVRFSVAWRLGLREAYYARMKGNDWEADYWASNGVDEYFAQMLYSWVTHSYGPARPALNAFNDYLCGENPTEDLKQMRNAWGEYRQYLKETYPPKEGETFKLKCEHHRKIDSILFGETDENS